MDEINYNIKTKVEALYYLKMADLKIEDYIPKREIRNQFLFELYKERYINADKTTLTKNGIEFLDMNFNEYGHDVKDI